MLAICAVLFQMTGERWILIGSGLLTLCAFAWMFLLTAAFSKRLSVFTRELCRAMDQMISGSREPVRVSYSDTLFARISYRLSRLYDIMQENRRKASGERQELQMLVSDVSHQVKTPVSNLKMVSDTLLSKPVTEEERREFLKGIRNQTEKLEFLFQALVKTSRLEIGAIRVFVEQWEMYVKIDVSDTGKGIPESNQGAVFRRFYREEEVHGEPGIGIGLYLAREIVTKQGGYIKVTSKIGKGSTFSVFLPWRYFR